MKNIYNYGDEVSFYIDEKEYVGTVEIIDRFGYFFDITTFLLNPKIFLSNM